MHDPMLMAHADDLGDGPGDGGRCALGVVSTGDDAVEELATLAELHDEVDVVGVLVGGVEADEVGVVGQGGHDLDLAADVLDVYGSAELALGDGLAGEGLSGLAVGAEERDAELAAAELSAEDILVAEAGAVGEGDDVFEYAEVGGVDGVFREGVGAAAGALLLLLLLPLLFPVVVVVGVGIVVDSDAGAAVSHRASRTRLPAAGGSGAGLWRWEG